jgi:hypothetical protein
VTIRDIRCYREARGGRLQVSGYSMASGASFTTGEPVVFDGSGFITEATTDPASIAGIAAVPATDVDGISHLAGTVVSIHESHPNQLWVCDNFATDGAGTAATPTQANAIGKTAGLILTAGRWVVDTGAGNTILRIDDVIDANGWSVTNPLLRHGTGRSVVFRFL